ncbi:hypothetical protein MKW98_029705 [Papaver atlanticum]|uniref:peptidylprolyl isomerase n=1 Tax=Papaver atlanticum TaxID=357466 RepID=A0AAD4T4D2_9MAGN|nr:hypothetical protein MKW98_029705 [Papaver atlanticum]
MAFWGIELVPEKPYTLVFDKSRGRLRISKATLGIDDHSEERSVVRCKVGDKCPILLCSLRPRVKESCSIDVEFNEDDDVVFEVIGPATTSVHLAGFYLAISHYRDNGQSDHCGLNDMKKTVDNGAEVNGRVRKFSNGLVIEDLVLNPERVSILATPGSTVLISYVGQLKSNSLVFDSSFSKPPFLFKLGAGEVIKGWDIGINGMRIGDKRRLTIPPSLAYGSKGRENVPPDSEVVFEIEMLKILR